MVQVLNSISPANVHLQVTCPPVGKNINAVHNMPLKTIAVLMGTVADDTLTQLASSCQGKAWEHITKVTIKAGGVWDQAHDMHYANRQVVFQCHNENNVM
jgi:hypothetical protein